MRVLLLLALVGMAAAECPDACSGHGFCGQYDKCTCYRNWMGNACEKRTCPYDLAFVDVPLGDLNMDGSWTSTHVTYGAQTQDRLGMEIWPTDSSNNDNSMFYDGNDDAHFYAECSNKGMCDRKSGLCSCFDGYSGTACRRVACPNDCSGHGTCERMEEFGEEYWVKQTENGNGAATYSGKYTYALWDRYKAQACHCDPGYFGIDCSNRYCPRGDDPLTTGQRDETQTMAIDCGAEACPTEDFRLNYVDTYGETWETRPIALKGYDMATASVNTDFAKSVKNALLAIPNSVFEDVDVTYRPHHTPIPGVATITSATVTTWAAGVVNDEVTSDLIDGFADTMYISDCTDQSAGDVAGTSSKEVQAIVSVTGGAITTAAFTKGLSAGTICLTRPFGGILDITFTANPGDLNNVGSTHAMMTDRGDTLTSNAKLTHAGTTSMILSVDTDFSAFIAVGDQIQCTTCTSAPTFTVTAIPTAPAAGTRGVIAVAEAYTTTGQDAKAMTIVTKGTKELHECAHRGLCDHSAGTCECFNGYTNDDCGMQQALAA